MPALSSKPSVLIGYMVFAMFAFAVCDVGIKMMGNTLPVSQILFLMGSVSAIFVGIGAIARGKRLLDAKVFEPLFILRTVLEFIGGLAFISAFVFGSLAISSAILQAVPVVVAFGGTWFFGQRVSIRQWVLISAGLIGVMIILSPWDASFQPVSLLAIVAVICLAGRDLIMRDMGRTLDTGVVSFWAFAGTGLGGFLMQPWMGEWQPLDAENWSWLGLTVTTLILAYTAVVRATREGQVAVIAPFRYSRLLFAGLLAASLFGEAITPSLLIGSAFIVASGILTLRQA